VVVEAGWSGGFLNEEPYEWVQNSDLLTDEERRLPLAVGVEVNATLLAAASRLPVGLSAPEHVVDPPFDPRIPGSWLVDLSHVEVDPRLPSPFTPTGSGPEGPAWYQTQTVTYAQELGYNVRPLEAYLRRQQGTYLQPWHDRLQTAYLDTFADLGVTRVLPDSFAARSWHAQADPVLAAVVAAIEATVEGGIGKLRTGPHDKQNRHGERWPALKRATWRPDIRAAVVAKARIIMHRKLLAMARMTGRYPLAVLAGCVVYPSPGPSPVDFLPYSTSGKPQPAGFRLGPAPGMVRLKGVRPMPWAVGLMEQRQSPACHIQDGDPALDQGE
jgi:hypothetical protein